MRLGELQPACGHWMHLVLFEMYVPKRQTHGDIVYLGRHECSTKGYVSYYGCRIQTGSKVLFLYKTKPWGKIGLWEGEPELQCHLNRLFLTASSAQEAEVSREALGPSWLEAPDSPSPDLFDCRDLCHRQIGVQICQLAEQLCF